MAKFLSPERTNFPRLLSLCWKRGHHEPTGEIFVLEKLVFFRSQNRKTTEIFILQRYEQSKVRRLCELESEMTMRLPAYITAIIRLFPLFHFLKVK